MQPTNVIRGTWREGVEPNVVNLTGTAFMEESGAHIFHVDGANASGAVAFTGDVSALFLRADDTYVRLDGSIVNGAAEVTLVSDCYHVPGRFSIAIYVSDGTTSTCVYAAVGNVYRTSSDVGIDSGDGIPNLVQLTAAYNACVTATEAAQTAALTAVTYAAQTGKTDAEKASARSNINAADAGLVDALHGLVDYDYGTPGTGSVGNASFIRTGILLAITGSNGTSTTPVRARLNGELSVASSNTAPSAWSTGLALTTGHSYRWIVRQVRGTSTKPPLARVYTEGSFTDIGGTAADNERDSVYTFVYASTPVNLCMAYARTGGAEFTNCVYECTLTDENSERDLPPAPTTAGTYTLKVTVANGIPSYTWVSDALLTSGGESE